MLPIGDDMACTKWLPKERNKNNKTKMAALGIRDEKRREEMEE